MKKNLMLLCCMLLIIQTGLGQSPTIFPSPGTITWCPGETFFYEVRTTGAQQTGCTYTWSVTNGTITGGQNTFKVSVVWENTTNIGSLTITLTNCKEATNTSKTENYVIRSVAGETPQNFRLVTAPVPLCNTNTVILSVNNMYVPNTGGSTGVTLREVDGYEWDIPTGWSGSSNTEQIFLTPSNGCIEGSARVRGYIDCGIKRYSNWSQPLNLREVHPFEITAPSGASSYILQCGNTSAVTFTATSISCASSYTWTFPAGWLSGGVASPVITTTNSITLTPLATPANANSIPGDLIVSANLGSCNRQSSLLLGYSDPKLSTPVFSSGSTQLVCSNSSGSVSVNTVPGAATYSWYTSGGTAYVNGVTAGSSNPVVTTSSTISISAPQISGAGYKIFLHVIANRPNSNCAGSNVRTREIWLGKPVNAQAIALGLDDAPPFYVCPNTTYQFNAFDFTNITSVTTFNWYTYNNHTIVSYNGVGNITANIQTGNTVHGTYISVRPQNSCGTASNWTDALLYQQGAGCSGGGGGCGFECSFSMSPNPTSDYVELSYNAEEEPLEDYQIRVYDTNGTFLFQHEVPDKKSRIDTRDLKEGVYIFKIITKKESFERRLFIKR